MRWWVRVTIEDCNIDENSTAITAFWGDHIQYPINNRKPIFECCLYSPGQPTDTTLKTTPMHSAPIHVPGPALTLLRR